MFRSVLFVELKCRSVAVLPSFGVELEPSESFFHGSMSKLKVVISVTYVTFLVFSDRLQLGLIKLMFLHSYIPFVVSLFTVFYITVKT